MKMKNKSEDLTQQSSRSKKVKFSNSPPASSNSVMNFEGGGGKTATSSSSNFKNSIPSGRQQPNGVFKKDISMHNNNHGEDDDDEDVNDDLLEGRKRRKGGFKSDVYLSEDEEDDEEGEGGEGGERGKRFAMGDSDDDTDDEAAAPPAQAKSGKGKKADEDEDDMFGSDNDEKDGKKVATPQNKRKTFIKSQDIEGQEWKESQGEEEEDEDDEGGEKIESFNMDQELAEGDFTQSGVYVRKEDDQARHDGWLQGIGKKEISRAREAHQAMLTRQDDQERLVVEREKEMTPDLRLRGIFQLMRVGESVGGAMKRLGAASAQLSVPKWKKPKKTSANAAVLTIEEMQACKASLLHLSTLATSAFDTDPDIYEKRYEDLALHLQSVRLIPNGWIPGNPLEF